MASLIGRPMALGVIGALALIAMVCVPVYGEYERGPTAYSFETTANCTGPTYLTQLVPNATLDLGLGACINRTTPGNSPRSRSYTCENGEFRTSDYHGSDTCEGLGEFLSYGTQVCFPGVSGFGSTKRDVESEDPFEAFLALFSSKRLPGDKSTVIVCNPGDPWTLAANNPANLSAPVVLAETVPCSAPGSCNPGAASATLFNSTGHDEPVCTEPLDSVEYWGGAIIGDCYSYAGQSNIKIHCTANTVFGEFYAYGCDGPWVMRLGDYYPYHDQCDRVLGQDVQLFCPPARVQPSPPSPPSPPSSAGSLLSPRIFLSVALMASISLF